MAGNTTDSINKAPVPDADMKPTEPDSSLPPIAKAPLSTAGASMVPSTTADTETTTAPTEPKSEPAGQNGATTADAPKDEPAKKADEDDANGSQPRSTSDDAPLKLSEETTENETSAAPALPNGDATEPPKSVSVEDVGDQDLPSSKSSHPSEATKAAKSGKPTDEAEKVDSAPVVTTGAEQKEVPEVSSAPAESEPEKTESTTGDKRKADDATSSAGESAANGAKDDEPPVEKKQKTNGAATNGAARKPGRPRKEKRAPAPVGRTARKTRSQGAAE